MRASTKSAEDTRELGAAVATVAKPGDVVLLAGDLGAGKTTFAQGFARAIGVSEPVTSPTFVIMQNYSGQLPLLHVDVYRLEHLQEVAELGLLEMLDEGAVALIEWGDVIAPSLAADFLEIRFEYDDDDESRLVWLRFVGRSWAAREPALAAALDRWLSGNANP